MAEAFIQLGHTVVGCSRNKDEIRKLQQTFSEPHHFVALDITDEAAIIAWSKQINEKYSVCIDLLINNAGIAHPPAPLWTIDSDMFNQVIDVNIKGSANIIRHFVPEMVMQNNGVIVNFSAGWGRYTAPNAAPYCASKWAIEGLTKALSQELPDGMAAVSLWPGTIHTETLDIIYGETKATNYISPQQWADIAIPFLLHIGASDNGKPLSIPTG